MQLESQSESDEWCHTAANVKPVILHFPSQMDEGSTNKKYNTDLKSL